MIFPDALAEWPGIVPISPTIAEEVVESSLYDGAQFGETPNWYCRLCVQVSLESPRLFASLERLKHRYAPTPREHAAWVEQVGLLVLALRRQYQRNNLDLPEITQQQFQDFRLGMLEYASAEVALWEEVQTSPAAWCHLLRRNRPAIQRGVCAATAAFLTLVEVGS